MWCSFYSQLLSILFDFRSNLAHIYKHHQPYEYRRFDCGCYLTFSRLVCFGFDISVRIVFSVSLYSFRHAVCVCVYLEDMIKLHHISR